MKNVFFTLTFMLISSVSFASTDVENELLMKLDSNIESLSMKSEIFNIGKTMLEISNELSAACCTVTDGHYEATHCDEGGNYRRACRIARRLLKEQMEYGY
jgi:hypothetical protein